MPRADAARVAILNGFGRALGDGIVGLQALHVALRHGAIPPDPVLFRLPGLPPVQQELYAAAGFAEVRTLPWEAATPDVPFPPAAAFARVVELRDFAFDATFRRIAMIDFFLGRLGLDPATIPGPEKRNTWLANHAPSRAVAGLGRAANQGWGEGLAAIPKPVLLCPHSSMPLRDMPPEIAAAITDFFGAHGKSVTVQAEAPSLAALCAQVAGAALVVSTDTAMVHLADAFRVPCLAFFPTHRPEWRVRDYPLCRAVHLPAPGLPEALEFSRGPDDLAAARRAWFPHGPDLSWLHAALRAALP